MALESVVIVGASLAGLNVAEGLRAGGYEGAVTLVGAEGELPYDRPPLSKELLRGEWSFDKALLRPASWYGEHDVALRLGVHATHVDPGARTVTLGDGDTLRYSHLVLATGGIPRRLACPGDDLAGVHVLRSARDVEAIRSGAFDARAAVVVGAGFIGAETAASLRALGLDVTMVELLSEPMERVLGTEVGAAIHAIHETQGVTVACGTGVQELLGGDGRVRAVACTDGSRYDADLVVVGVGIVPDTAVAEQAGCDLGDGVLVDDLGRTSVEGIYAAGDVACGPLRVADRPVRVEHHASAIEQGRTVAHTIAGTAPPAAQVPWFWSDQYDVRMQYAGHAETWDELVWRGDHAAAADWTVLYLQDGRLRAGLCANRPREFRGVRELLAAGVHPSVAELADPDADLRALAKAVA